MCLRGIKGHHSEAEYVEIPTLHYVLFFAVCGFQTFVHDAKSPILFLQHMIKYRYLPFTHGKTKYKGKEDTGKVFSS